MRGTGVVRRPSMKWSTPMPLRRWPEMAAVLCLLVVGAAALGCGPPPSSAAYRPPAIGRVEPQSALTAGHLPFFPKTSRLRLRQRPPQTSVDAPLLSRLHTPSPATPGQSPLLSWISLTRVGFCLLAWAALLRVAPGRHRPPAPFHPLALSPPPSMAAAAGPWRVLAVRARRRGPAGAAAPEKSAAPLPVAPPVPTSLEGEITESFLRYAMSVVLGRTLPDVRDGLKPVHRRILYALHDMGLTAGARYRKSAAVVGDVLGKYHPHGDTAVYDALVRMAQDFTMSEMLVDGQGNFGSIDADPPAAMRYTECRLRRLASTALLADLSAGTVDYTPTYDGSRQEPTVLPARLPLLLINGSSGIAVGMATSIPPHNLGEVVDACTLLVDARIAQAKVAAGLSTDGAPTCVSDEQLRRAVPAPDFPTGGLIVGRQGVDRLYSEGAGSILMRAKIHMETVAVRGAKPQDGRQALVVTELPYMMVKGRLVEQLLQDLDAGTLQGVESVRDESDREGVRVVIVVKRGAEPAVVENNLLKRRLQTNFSANMIAITHTVDGAASSSTGLSPSAVSPDDEGTGGKPVVRRPRPERMTLRGILDAWLDFRYECVLRRARHSLKRADAEAHIKDGLAAALRRLNDVVDVIRQSRDVAEARAALCHSADAVDPTSGRRGHGLSRLQADAVLETPLSRLTALQQEKLEAQRAELHALVDRLRRFIASDAAVYAEIGEELRALRVEFGRPRRTVLLDAAGSVSEEDLVQNAGSVVAVSKYGSVRRLPLADLRATAKPGSVVAKAILGRSTKAAPDRVAHLLACRDHDYVLAITRDGVAHHSRAYRVPALAASANSKGVSLATVFRLPSGAMVTHVLALPKEEVGMEDVEEAPPTDDGAVEGEGEVVAEVEVEGGAEEEEEEDGEEQDEGGEEEAEEAEGGAEQEDVPAITRSEKFVVVVTKRSMLRKVPFPAWEKWLRGGGRGAIRAMRVRAKDAVRAAAVCTDADDLVLVTARGHALRVAVHRLTRRGLTGAAGAAVMVVEPGDELVGMAVLPAGKEPSDIVLVTAHGMVKRLQADLFRSVKPGKARPVRAIGLREGDRVAAACAAAPADQLLFASAGGTLLSHHCRSVPAQGRAAKGAALKRRGWAGASDPIVDVAVLPAGADLGESDADLAPLEETEEG